MKFYNEKYGTNHEKREFHNYRFWEILGGTRERMTEIIHEYHETDFTKDVEIIDGVYEVIQSLYERGEDNYIITSRPEYMEPHTQAIIEKLFGKNIKDIYFDNHFSMRGTPKKEIINMRIFMNRSYSRRFS